ncbi:helix-turn-helix protein [Prauserella shujinwangii]|uniref:Helix-turn-helix protein n=1 Tax=Prauserella shujinwangii TaxID=1453103 RepID=A0A2T0M3C8_9PSEU|nr:winged helix-turn-helix domain-containing protein [Prauserella shujinwangii]PRX51237.1 helix-turn-helix protein [Prauserella shujinwangii]
MTETADPVRLAGELRDLRRRVEALERQAAPSSGGEGTLWALEALRRRLPEREATAAGAVLFTGSLTLPTGEPVEWQQGAASAELLDSDWADLSPTLAALAHPVRLELLRQVLGGTRTTAELAETGAPGSTGQLHHHLRQLVNAGWLRQGGRGSYEMPPARVVPLLVTLAAVRR